MTEQSIQDEILRNALQLQRLSAGDQARADELVRQLTRDLRSLLTQVNISEATKREIEDLIKQAEKVIDPSYKALGEVVDTQGIAAVVADQTIQLVEGMQPITPHVLASLSRDVLIDGAVSSAWWARQAEDTQFKFGQAVRQGKINGETLERIVARVAGPNGFMDIAKRNARALVHSSVMTAANHARLATFRANADKFKGVRWLATLDGITCPRCAALDGQAWDLDGNKLPGTEADFIAPPIHWNDRCVLSPIPRTDTLDELFPGLADKLQATMERASQFGPVHGSTTFNEFLKRQSPQFIENTLGKARAELFRAGKITVRDLISGAGRELTLNELRN